MAPGKSRGRWCRRSVSLRSLAVAFRSLISFSSFVSAGMHRKNSFKKVVGLEDSRRSREEVTVQLRKNKREEQIAKRRMGPSKQIVDPTVTEDSPSTTNVGADKDNEYDITLARISTAFQSCQQNDTNMPQDELLGYAKELRRMSACKNPPIKKIIAYGLVPFVVELLGYQSCPDVMFEASWVLTNVASTSHARVVADNGAVPHLSKLLTHSSPEIREQAIWCLGNIASDSVEFRDGLLNFPAVVSGMYVALPLCGSYVVARTHHHDCVSSFAFSGSQT